MIPAAFFPRILEPSVSQPKTIPIPQHLHEVVEGVFDLCKQAAAELDERDRIIASLKKEAGHPPPAAPAISKEQALVYAHQLKQASLLPREDINLEKLAEYISRNPQWLVEQLLQTNLPPEPQGEPEKQAFTISGEERLIDHDGWMECIRPKAG